jgi:hypothetical protein
MALTVQQIRPVAHVPFILGVLRRLEVGTIIERPHRSPPKTCDLDWAWGRSHGPGDARW